MAKVRRKSNKNSKYDMKTTLIGRDQLELSRRALELLRNPDFEDFACSERKGRRGKSG